MIIKHPFFNTLYTNWDIFSSYEICIFFCRKQVLNHYGNMEWGLAALEVSMEL